MTAELRLSGNLTTSIDKKFFDELSQFSWQALKIKDKVYAARTTPEGKTEYLHRRITDAAKGFEVDHIDGNGLNNTLANLRVVTNSENQRNSKKSKANTSGFKGVSLNKASGKYDAYLYLNRKKINLGGFKTPEAASHVVEKNRLRVHGEFGRRTS